MQTVTLELTEVVYQNAQRLARASPKSVEVILQDSTAHTLPPLDDMSPDEAGQMAQLALLDDASLWREARQMLTREQEQDLRDLLHRQDESALTPKQRTRLEQLMDSYGRLTVRKAHAYLLLARRGYRVPMQEDLH